MEEREYQELIEKVRCIMFSDLFKFIKKNSNNDECLYELKKYIEDALINKYSWDIEKVHIVLAVLQLENRSDIQEILSYLEQSNFGWQGDKYRLYNNCLQFDQHCRRNYYIDNTPEMTERIFADIDEIFLHKEYGAITTYLFGYSLAALFSSILKNQHGRIPYFLQIACKRSSNTYRLVHEIVRICDVNTGLFKHCDGFNYKECDHEHMTIYPAEIGEKALEQLLYYKDIPVIVEGYENEKMYKSLIRETANIPNRTKRLDLKAKFKILPIFLCPVIQSQFRNIVSMDLSNLDISDEYIELLIENKQRLGSWAFELVRDAKAYFDVGNSTAYSADIYEKLIKLRKPKDETLFFYDLEDHCNRLRIEYNSETRLTSGDVTNIGYLTYFFSHYMKVFKHSIRLTRETKFTYRMIFDNHDPQKLIEQIKKQATDALFQLHNIYSPAVPEKMNIDIDSSDVAEVKRIRKEGTAYAKDIVKYYQSYGVSIQILSDAKYIKGRYVFSVKLMPGTDKKLLNRYLEDIRILLEVEVLISNMTSSGIRLILAKQPLNENSLINILKSPKFGKSKMEIPYAVGYDIIGDMVIADITEFPHLLIGGATNSGKSSALHSLLMSIIYRQPADKVKLLLLDFGASELKIYDNVPHMIHPTIRSNEIEKGRYCLSWLQTEMENRLVKKDQLDVRSFEMEIRKWSSIVCVIDEFPAFVRKLTAERNNKKAYIIIEDLLERARKVKIYLVLAAQNSAKGNIEIRTTNIGARIAFKCNNRYESQAIIESSDAVNLSGKGAMYFKCDQHEGLRRIQGSYMPLNEIADMLDRLDFKNKCSGKQYDEIEFQFNSLHEFETDQNSSSVEDEDEKLLLEMVMWMQDKETISSKKLMDEYKMGFKRADKFLACLENDGIISKKQKKKSRIVDQDKVKDFLNKHGHMEHVNDNELSQIDMPNIQTDEGSIQDKSKEPVVEMLDAQRNKDNYESDLPTPKKQQKVDMKSLRGIESPKTMRRKTK